MDTLINTDNNISFSNALLRSGLPILTREPLRDLQINLGRLCNQACHHCHVDAGPKRTEIMSWDVMERILDWAKNNRIRSVDLTGGAPEINPHFRKLVDGFLQQGAQVTVRCNLTVLWEPGQEDLAQWYAERSIKLACSLPCYTRDNVDAQRGKNVFNKSIRALKALNDQGYGKKDHLPLDLVYNPGGPFLPPEQSKLQQDYKERLSADFGVVFSSLLTITNLPISRFRHALERDGELQDYQQLLDDNFNPETLPGLMCRHLISVDWMGRIYDCDFNQMLDIPLAGKGPRKIWELDLSVLQEQSIAVGDHCLGCTAGSGSSCGGALV
ncbi:MAG: arsenosugar biosynthesis radical SAM protein ArsS [Gammaproteobacteria bacterium]|nr:MAG: arsenosugar biosynthesis radical SAM protein ArsS [Gammaproteobacteria bacterium]